MASFNEYLQEGKLFFSEEDREHIYSLPELQREQILHERFLKIKDREMKEQYQNLDRKQEETVPIIEKPRPKHEDCKCIVTRDIIIKNMFKPFISVLKGTFVRALINKSPIVCKIVGVRIVEKYKIELKVPITTSLGVDLDTSSKILEGVQLKYISNTKPSVEEIEEFINNFTINSFDDLNKKYEKIMAELNRSLTDSEVTKMVENRLKDNPKKLTNTEKKIEIISKRDEAIQMKNKEKAIYYQNQLEKIEDEERIERAKKQFGDNETKKSSIN